MRPCESKIPAMLWNARQMATEPGDGGWASISFCQIAAARRCDSSDLVTSCSPAMCIWMVASLSWNSVTVGWTWVSFCPIAKADSKDFIASTDLPVRA